MLRIRIRVLGLPDPDPLLRRADTDPSIIKENSKKNLKPYCLITSLSTFSLKNDADVTSKSNEQRNLGKKRNF
jgi:hypothetical protein